MGEPNGNGLKRAQESQHVAVGLAGDQARVPGEGILSRVVANPKRQSGQRLAFMGIVDSQVGLIGP